MHRAPGMSRSISCPAKPSIQKGLSPGVIKVQALGKKVLSRVSPELGLSSLELQSSHGQLSPDPHGASQTVSALSQPF